MSEVTPTLVKELREKTGAGMMDCKNALQEAAGSIEGAIEVLRKKGLKDIGKRASKVAAEGTIGVYTHSGDQIVAIVELNSETDFVARSAEFRELARNIAMHVAASDPSYLDRTDVPSEILEKEKEIFFEQLTEQQRKNVDKIMPGKLEKFYQERVLLEQPYVKDSSGKLLVRNLVEELSAKVGEKIAVRRYIRFRVGEGIEKSQVDFTAEVQALTSAV